MWSLYHEVFWVGFVNSLNPQASWDGAGFAGFAGMRTYGAAAVFEVRVLFQTLKDVWVERASGIKP